MLNFHFLEKGLGIVFPPILFMIFPEFPRSHTINGNHSIQKSMPSL